MGRVGSTPAVTGPEVGYTLQPVYSTYFLETSFKEFQDYKNVHSTNCQKQNDGAINAVELYRVMFPAPLQFNSFLIIIVVVAKADTY